MNKMVILPIFAVIFAVAVANPTNQLHGHPGGIGGRPVIGLPNPFFNQGSGTGSGAGTVNANAGGLSISAVGTSSAANGGSGQGSSIATGSENFFTGQVDGSVISSGTSSGK